jgi:hypothetical protein
LATIKEVKTMDLDNKLDLGYKWNRAAWLDRTNEIGCKVIKFDSDRAELTRNDIDRMVRSKRF